MGVEADNSEMSCSHLQSLELIFIVRLVGLMKASDSALQCIAIFARV